jgi:hypothetical protein
MTVEAPELPTRLGWYVVFTNEDPGRVCMFMPSDGPDVGEVLCERHRYPALEARFAQARWRGPFVSRLDAERALAFAGSSVPSLDAARARSAIA